MVVHYRDYYYGFLVGVLLKPHNQPVLIVKAHGIVPILAPVFLKVESSILVKVTLVVGRSDLPKSSAEGS